MSKRADNGQTDKSTSNSVGALAPSTDSAGPPNWLAAVLLAVAIAIVYGRALDVPFVFDDNESVVTNTSIRSLWPLIGTDEHRGPLNPVRDLPTTARPVVNYSFALNYYFGGLDLTGYHLVNFIVHFGNAMLLLIVVRRTLQLPYFGGRFAGAAGWLAFAAALLWSVHPLLTDAVVYITQRTELLMAWFYLATLYCSLRYWSTFPLPRREGLGEGSFIPSKSLEGDTYEATSSRRTLWLTLAIVACLCGMLSKEVMVSAPIVILLFDRTFISRSFGAAFRRSWKLYLGLALTWIPLLVLSRYSPRSKSSGFELCENFHNVFLYWLTQCKVLLMYLKLAAWPWPLRCAYELPKVDSFASFCIYVVPVLLMSALALWLLKRNSPIGFVFVFVGAVLAPTSIVPILTEMAAERRMYLPLAALMAAVVVAIYLFVRRQLAISRAAGDSSPNSKAPILAAAVSVILLVTVYSIVGSHRISDYHNQTLMWQQVADSQPLNYMAHYNLGLIYNEAGREADSIKELQTSIEAHPRYPASRSALGFALMHAGRMPEALASIQAALEINPEYVPALNNMGIALTKLGNLNEAIQYLERAVRLDPGHADAHNNLGEALLQVGRTAEAEEQFRAAQSLTPGDAGVLYNLAMSHRSKGDLTQAIDLFERAIKIRPDFAEAHINLGVALHQSGNIRGAAEHFERFQQLRPNDPGGYANLAIIAAGEGDLKQADALYQKVATLMPDAPEPHFMLASSLIQIGKVPEAIKHFERALELNPKMLASYAPLADALVATNRTDEAKQIATRGIEMAKANGDQESAKKLQEWLSRH
jgi:tetratricopeptide (TPR) repeat protein